MQLKAMLKAHPELWASITDALGHAPNIGWTSRPYSSKPPGWQPPSNGPKEQLRMPYWEMTAEHVVPDMLRRRATSRA